MNNSTAYKIICDKCGKQMAHSVYPIPQSLCYLCSGRYERQMRQSGVPEKEIEKYIKEKLNTK
jgi:hypothetical protein